MADPSLAPSRSEAQRQAARINGARSRGPVTAEGKARASMNAFRHGLRAATDALAPGEDPQAFADLLATLRAEHRPENATEELLVERLAVTFWKLARCDRLEAELAACRPRPPAGRVYPDGTPALLSRAGEFATLSAHAARLERALHRLLKALAERPRSAVRETAREPAAAACSADAAQHRPNEPEPEAAAPPPSVEGPTGSPPPAPAENLANEPELEPPVAPPEPTAGDRPDAPLPGLPPDPEAALLEAARSDPALALAIATDLAEAGELARLRRVLDVLGLDLATLLAGPPPAAERAAA